MSGALADGSPAVTLTADPFAADPNPNPNPNPNPDPSPSPNLAHARTLARLARGRQERACAGAHVTRQPGRRAARRQVASRRGARPAVAAAARARRRAGAASLTRTRTLTRTLTLTLTLTLTRRCTTSLTPPARRQLSGTIWLSSCRYPGPMMLGASYGVG